MTWKQSFTGAVAFVGSVAFVALAGAAQAADLKAVTKAPPPEQQQASGYVEVYTGWARTDSTYYGFEVFDIDGWALGGAGRANYWFSRDVSVQVDAQAEGTQYDNPYGGNGHFSTHSYLVGGHLSWRNPQQYLFGLFAAAGDAGGGFAPATRHGLIGAEAQWYWNQFTLYVQGGYDTTLGTVGFDGIDDINAWFLRGTGRYFITPNFLIEATGMYASGDINFTSGGWGFETWLWQAKAEWRFPTAPFSIFAKYQGSETKYDDVSLKVRDDRVLFGLKLNMGDRNLQATDRAGATLDIISPLSNPASPVMVPFGGLD
jgi:hypothetical protein